MNVKKKNKIKLILFLKISKSGEQKIIIQNKLNEKKPT